MKHSEKFALSHFLSFFPENDSFDTVLAKIDQRSADIIRWTHFKNFSSEDVIDLIHRMTLDIEKQFFPFHDLVTVIDRDTVKTMFFHLMARSPMNDELSRVCSFLDSDFSYQLQSKIADALKILNIQINN